MSRYIKVVFSLDISNKLTYISLHSNNNETWKELPHVIEKLQGYGYDHLILKLEWARTSAPKDSSTQYVSGYGQALAKNTNAKGSYTSNLTR